jgi:hypothetical protein
MVLFQIDAIAVPAFKLESDTPWSIHVDCISRRIETMQLVKLETGNVHLFDSRRSVEAAQDTGLQSSVNACRFAFFP